MIGIRHLPLGAALLVLLARPALAQPTSIEQAREEARRILQGNASRTPEELRKSQQNWRKYDLEIDRASKDQDEAIAKGGRDLDLRISLYLERTRQSYATAVDHYLAGRILGLAKRVDEAKVHFERALALDPYFFWAEHGLGTYYYLRNMPGPAAKHYRAALDINPDYLNSELGLAQSQAQLGRREDAELTLRVLLDRHPKNVEALWILANLLVDAGRYLEAVDVLLKVQSLEPELPDLSSRLALCYRRSEQIDKAIAIYEQLIAANAKEWRSCIALGDILHRQGHNHAAAEAFQKALDRMPVQANVDRGRLEELVVALRAGPAEEKVNPNRKSPAEWIEILLNAAEPERRRHAARVLGLLPWNHQALADAFLKALMDKDDHVRVLALKVIDREWPDESLSELGSILRLLMKDRSPLVRGMVASLLGDTRHPASVPPLIAALDEQDPYAFRELHRALNRLTFAYIEVDDPDEMDAEARARIAKAWRAWYEAERDRYRKFEATTR